MGVSKSVERTGMSRSRLLCLSDAHGGSSPSLTSDVRRHENATATKFYAALSADHKNGVVLFCRPFVAYLRDYACISSETSKFATSFRSSSRFIANRTVCDTGISTVYDKSICGFPCRTDLAFMQLGLGTLQKTRNISTHSTRHICRIPHSLLVIYCSLETADAVMIVIAEHKCEVDRALRT